jgi:hypothetical protein
MNLTFFTPFLNVWLRGLKIPGRIGEWLTQGIYTLNDEQLFPN